MAKEPKTAKHEATPTKWLDPASYRGAVLHGRWQVDELGVGLNCYVVYDREKRQLVRDSQYLTRHFSSITAAEACVDELAGIKPSRKSARPQAVKQPSAAKKLSAAQLFRDLLIAGGLTDDEIFAKVKDQFNLPDSRRGYVDWYRKDLKKKGLL